MTKRSHIITDNHWLQMLTSQLWSESNHNGRTTTLRLEPIARVIKCTKKWSAPSDQMANFVHPEKLWSRIDHVDQIRLLHDDRRGKGSVHHVDYIWLASTRLGAGAMKQAEIVVVVMVVIFTCNLYILTIGRCRLSRLRGRPPPCPRPATPEDIVVIFS